MKHLNILKIEISNYGLKTNFSWEHWVTKNESIWTKDGRHEGHLFGLHIKITQLRNYHFS